MDQIEIKDTSEISLTANQKEELYELIRVAYAETEKEIWGDNYIRASRDELNDYLDRGEFLLVLDNEHVVGCVHYSKNNPSSTSFGLLATHNDYKHYGIGSALISAVEQKAKENGSDDVELTILRPYDGEVASKSLLKNWYEGKGYCFIQSIDFSEVRPERAKRLLVPCSFDYYRKEL